MNSVPVDETAVRAELEELAGVAREELAPGPLEPGISGEPATPPPAPMDWTLPAQAIVRMLYRVVWPNWQLEASENAELAEGTAVVLAAFFPTVNIDPRVQALLALGGTIATIAGRRFDRETGKLKPLHAPPPADDAQSELQFGGAQDRATA